MTTINLKEFFYWYTKDESIVVSDEVAAELRSDKRYESTHQQRMRRNKSQYSLDVGDGIENAACEFEPSPEGLAEHEKKVLKIILIGSLVFGGEMARQKSGQSRV